MNDAPGPNGASTTTDHDRPPLTKTVLLTIALPDFYAEDMTAEQAEEFYGGDPREQFYEEAGLITSTMRLLVMRGDKCGNELFDLRAVLVGSHVVDRERSHDEPEDERLTEAIEEWREWSCR